MTTQEDDVVQESIYVVLDLPFEQCTAQSHISLTSLDSPLVKVNETLYKCEYDETVGTDLILQQNPLEYVGSTTKKALGRAVILKNKPDA